MLAYLAFATVYSAIAWWAGGDGRLAPCVYAFREGVRWPI